MTGPISDDGFVELQFRSEISLLITAHVNQYTLATIACVAGLRYVNLVTLKFDLSRIKWSTIYT